MDTLSIQRALNAAGFDPGALDGAWGVNTRRAVRKFQAASGLEVDGIVGPETLAKLFPRMIAVPTIDPPWYDEARRKIGLQEVQNYSTLMSWFRTGGGELGDIRKLPWCGEFVQVCIALTLPDEPQPANPYFAQNWAKFGRALATPTTGAIMVFVRPGGGHVAFYVSEDATHYSVLGGNQSNRVSIARVAKERCIGTRWPSTYPLPTTGKISGSVGAVSKNEA